MAKDGREDWKISMGRRLLKELKRLDMSQAELTRRLGDVTKQLVNHWTTGRSELTTWDLVRL